MHHASIMSDIVTELQEVLQQEKAMKENPTIIPEPVNHVANVVQIKQQQLATQLQ